MKEEEEEDRSADGARGDFREELENLHGDDHLDLRPVVAGVGDVDEAVAASW